MSFKAINEFFTAFLENHGDEDILSKWKEESKGLNKIMKKKEKKEKKKSSGLSKNKSAYIFFCLEERAEIAKENPELSSKEITKILAKNWSDLKENDEDRLAELKEKALKDKERYTKEKSDSENEKSDGEDNNTTEPKKKKKKTSVYMIFCKEERSVIKEEFPEYSSKEVITELGRRWTELKSSKSDKMAYYENLKKQQDSDDEEVVEKEEVVVEKEEEVVVEDDEEEEIKPKKKASKKKKIVEEEVEEEEVKPKKKANKKKSA